MANQTLEITNFSGALTRNNFGPINSGLAQFDTSWGYNPFFNVGQLTWLKSPGIVVGVTGLVLARCSRIESAALVNYVITNAGNLYRLTADGSGVSLVRTLVTGSPTFTYGADITFYGAANTLFISHDLGVTKIIIDGSGNFVSETQVGTWDGTHFTPITTRRGMCQFGSKLYAVNGDASVTYANNIAEIDSTLTVTSYTKLSPSLPAGSFIRDLDLNSDLTYMLISASFVPSELIAPVNDGANSAGTDSTLYQWNGVDVGATVGINLPSFGVTALQSFSGRQMMFMYDTFGTSLYEGGKKVKTLRNSKSPMPGATASAGNFITWMNPEFYWNQDAQAGSINLGLFYYGRLDEDTPVGLWRLLRQTSAIGGTIYSVPMCCFTTNRYVTVNTSDVIQPPINGSHLYSFIDYSGSGGSTNYRLYIFQAAPPDDSVGGWTGAVAGVYETQTQMFPEKWKVTQARVYTSPTVSNNGFNIDFIGSAGTIISNSSSSYTYASGTDTTQLQGSLNRINFNPTMTPDYGIGVRITNTGGANMTISKIELDLESSGK